MKHEKDIKSRQASGSRSKGRIELETVCTDRGICKDAKNTQRWKPGNYRKAPVGTGLHASDDFIRQVFKAKAVGFITENKLRFTKKIQREFNSSLLQLMEYYNLNFNLANTGIGFTDCLNNFKTAQSQLSPLGKLELRLARDTRGKVALCTAATFSTGRSLFYMPVFPLYRFLKEKKFQHVKPATLVLLSACAYLYLYAGVPMFTESSYIGYQYDYLDDWLNEEIECYPPETENAQNNLKELEATREIGQYVKQKFCNEMNLQYLQQRINRIQPRTQYEQFCHTIGTKVLELYKNHKDKNIFRYAASLKFRECDDHYITHMDQYISFIGSNDGNVSELLYDTVNNELNEHYDIQEPEIIICLMVRPS